ncbi:DgyrCDS3201 [Dimorphilus gyrociliatus]|uniref:DgyrCDS3201 n=1 Tax=Dimorphilus gyrociliatus TaxID=2664684 RepID=A0A7I8VCH3_9ANNE|nr:DgyrCDS3201 [Dimorphilus gyrociliatus]
MSSICNLFVKTIEIDTDSKSSISINNDVQNFGIKIRPAKEEELDTVANLFLNGYRERLSNLFEEEKREFFIDMIKDCYESNPNLIQNVLVALEDDKIQGICSIKYSNDELKTTKSASETFNLVFSKAHLKTIFSFGMNQYLSNVEDDEALIEILSVDPECKMEKEIKGLLLQAADDECQERRCKKLSSIVMFKDFELRRFYEDFGYITSKMHLARPSFMYGDKGMHAKRVENKNEEGKVRDDNDDDDDDDDAVDSSTLHLSDPHEQCLALSVLSLAQPFRGTS